MSICLQYFKAAIFGDEVFLKVYDQGGDIVYKISVSYTIFTITQLILTCLLHFQSLRITLASTGAHVHLRRASTLDRLPHNDGGEHVSGDDRLSTVATRVKVS